MLNACNIMLLVQHASSFNTLLQVEQREASMLQQLQLEMSTLVDEMAIQRECSVQRICVENFHAACTVQMQRIKHSQSRSSQAGLVRPTQQLP